MSSHKIYLIRLKKELEMMSKNPSHGITCWQNDENSTVILVEMTGPEGSPYEHGVFSLEVQIGEKYPFLPPNVKFLTPIYHPNIDQQGRICLAGLKPQPTGCWTVALNIPIILNSIRILLSEPNLGDPLMADIAKEVAENFQLYREKAIEYTRKHAQTQSNKKPLKSCDNMEAGESTEIGVSKDQLAGNFKKRVNENQKEDHFELEQGQEQSFKKAKY